MLHWVLLLAVGMMGFAGTFFIGHFIEKESLKSWSRQAKLDVSVATIAAQTWLAQSETIVSGLALGFEHPDEITQEKFDKLVIKAEGWNSEFSLDAVAVVQRILRPQRDQMEQVLGHSLKSVLEPSEDVPDAVEYMVVTNSTETAGPLRRGVDLLTMEKMAVVVQTAKRVSDQAILGPAFRTESGRLYSLVGIGVPQSEGNTIIVGKVDLSELIETLLSDHLPIGIILRLGERDNEDRAETQHRPIYGTQEPSDQVVQTEVIRVTRGQARWTYNWDITTDYLGGPPTANVTMFQIAGLIITMLVVYSIGILSVQNVVIQRTEEERKSELTRQKSEREITKKEQLESERKLAIHLNNTPTASIAWDKNFTCFEWNPAAERIFGFTREEAVGKHAFNFIVDEDLHGQIDEIFQALLNQSGGSHSVNQNITKDRQKITCEWFNTPIIGDDGSTVGVSSFAQDITENQIAKQKLEESEKTFRNFYEIVPDVFMITDTESGECVEVNDGFCQLTGYSRAEVIGKSSTDLGLWVNPSDREQLVRGLKENGIVNNLAANFYRKDKSVWPGMMSACVVTSNGQRQILSSTKNVTDIRNSEMKALKASQAKSEFLASMSHELRTPLTSSIGSLGLLNSVIPDEFSDDAKELLEIAIRNNEKLLRLVNELLDFEKILSGRIEIPTIRHDISHLVERIVNDNQGYARIQSVRFVFDKPEAPLYALVQEHRFEQILNNLLSNAAKFSGSDSDVEIATYVENNCIVISVLDYGPGIPEAFKAEIFDPFTQVDSSSTRQHGGTGLGLSISKALTEGMGGTIEFDTEEGRGSTFRVSFPIIT